MIRAIYLDQELKRFSNLRICTPSTHEEALCFVLGGELADLELIGHESPNVYEGKSRPDLTSQLLKMSMTLDNDPMKPFKARLEFIEEHKKSLVLRNEMIEWHNSIIEIGYEHYLFGLGWSTDSVIVQDWKVCKRIEDV